MYEDTFGTRGRWILFTIIAPILNARECLTEQKSVHLLGGKGTRSPQKMSSVKLVRWPFIVAGILFLAGCAEVIAAHDGDADRNDTDDPCSEGETRCGAGQTVETCTDNAWQISQYCAPEGQLCSDGQCVTCPAGERYCQGHDVYECNPAGTAGQMIMSCDERGGETCLMGECISLCTQAAATDSYIGCEYWPTVTANPALDNAFQGDFSIAVSNAHDFPVTVTVHQGTNQVVLRELQGEAVEIIALDYVGELKGTAPGPYESLIAPASAYYLQSSAPVTVYQFNPLNYTLSSECANPQIVSPPCYSKTNDASLLLPAHVLSTNYLVMSLPTGGSPIETWTYYAGYFTVVATQDDTIVTVRFTAHTTAGNGQLDIYEPGDTDQFQLSRGDVLQVLSADCTGQTSDPSIEYCAQLEGYDLTGTVIESTAPVAVFSGHSCANVPYNVGYCDHLEEQLFPSEAWGREFIVTGTEPQSPGEPESNVYKILSREDDNQLTFFPSTVHEPVVLDRGRHVEFLSTQCFRVVSTEPILVGQFTVGQSMYTSELDGQGDPSFSLIVPFEQYRTSYSFLVPSTITSNFVNVIAEVGEEGQDVSAIELDGQPISFVGVTRVGESNYGVVRVDLSSDPSRTHTLLGERPFGVMVYGFAAHTSYAYPGGLDLEFINPLL